MKDDGSGRKIAVHAIIGGIMSQITGAGFASGAVGAGLNEALIKNLKGKDPGTAQIVSAIIGAAAAKVAGGSAAAGASAAATGTKWNKYEKLPRIKEQLEHLPEQEIYQSLRDGDYILLYDFEENRYSVCIAVNNKGEAWDIPLGDHGYKVKIPESGYVPYTVYDGNVTGAQQDDMFRDRKYIGKLIPATGESVPLKEQKDQTNSFKEFAAVAHEGLDLAGYVPGFGSAAGAAETVLYLAEGDYESAGSSAIGIIPFVKVIKKAKKFLAPFKKIENKAPAHLPEGKPNESPRLPSESSPEEDISRFNASTSRNETTLNDIQSKLSGLGTKNERYIKKRGWSIDSIKDVIQHPHTTRKAFNKSTGSEATVYYNKQGDYVVIDNNTKELIQTSKYGDKNWIPDSTIQDPYKPHN